ncbi:MAG TPA: hypothetical protein VIH59_37270 [Candidatus Tectomicrobia bacterium]
MLVLTDAIQVKRQKAKGGKGAGNPGGERATKRVNTDVWLVERVTGDFAYLSAGLSVMGTEVGSATACVRWQLYQEYGGRSASLPVVAISDGAKAMRCQLEELFGQPVPLSLDRYHIEKKVWELMSMVACNQREKEGHIAHLLDRLWHGAVRAALE